MSGSEHDLAKRISIDAHTNVVETSNESIRLLHATSAILRLVDITSPSPEAALMRSALEAAGVVREGEPLTELHEKVMGQIKAVTASEKGIAAAAQRNIDFVQDQPSVPFE